MILSDNNQQNIELLNFSVIKKVLIDKHPNLLFEYEFVRRITMQNKSLQSEIARSYFLGEYSSPILCYVSKYVFSNDLYQDLLGEYYEFISKVNNKIPYYKLALFKNFKNSSLRNYVTAITIRHFVDSKIKEDKINRNMISIDGASTVANKENEIDVIENPWFNLLIGNTGSDEECSISNEFYEKMEYAFSKLPERDVKVIKLMIMDGISGLEAFDELKDDLKKTAKIPTSEWTTKQKQDAMALLKGRALKHLIKIINDEKIDFR